MKPITFLGDSLEELRAFPQGARRAAGMQLDKVQRGLMPDNWKPMKTVGTGVCEIRVKDESGIYRVVYIAAFAEAVYVLHVFQKEDPENGRIRSGTGKGKTERFDQET